MDSEEDIVKGYAVGADDYITKPFYMQALVSKIHAIMKRYVQAAELEILVSGSISLSITGNRVRKNEEYITLTAREQKLLFYFMKNPMRILSKNQLFEALWDVDGDFVDDSMDEELNIGRQAIILIKYPMYMILIMIAVIGFMNLINTMIISIVTRKRELGILQAIGLSDRQLTKMLVGEGLVFTVGTLLASISKRVHKESLIERIRSE